MTNGAIEYILSKHMKDIIMFLVDDDGCLSHSINSISNGDSNARVNDEPSYHPPFSITLCLH